MCGVMGMILNPEQDKSIEELDGLRDRFSSLLRATEIRGKDASGAFVVNKTGVSVHKSQGSATKLTRTPMWGGLMNKIGNETLGAIGHTRFATKGCPTCSDNNHPIVINRQILGVHNGMLINDEELKEIFPYEQEVDSAAIFSAMYGLTGNDPLTSEVVGDTLGLIEGDMAIGVVDVRDTSRIFIARDNGRPLYLLEDKDALWIASTPEILSVGLRTMARLKSESLDAFSVMEFNGSRNNKEVTKW